MALLAWLTECRCTHVAMEATGVYWTPVWKILSEGDFELIVANAAHIKQVPGRKTDMNDAMWIADLLACGLIKASFVPEEDIQELRSLMRTRKQLVREQTRHIQRIQKTLEEANIKLNSVISDIMGVSGRRMIEAMIAGVRNPHQLAALADRGIKASPKELYDALHGRLTRSSPLSVAAASRTVGCDGCVDPEIDQGVDGRIERMDEAAARTVAALSRTDPSAVLDPRRQCPLGDDDPRGDRPRHEPLPDRRASDRMGRAVSGPERERRQRNPRACARAPRG